jgi:hypothetical protein
MDATRNIQQLRPAPSPAMLQILIALQNDSEAISPLELLTGQRLNLTAFCAVLNALPNVAPSMVRALAPGIAAFLREDYPAMLAEEENGLLPALRRRLLLGDDLDQVIDQLIDEHQRDRLQAISLANRCEEVANGVDDDDLLTLCASLRSFAEHQRRHLAWEDATILPLAQVRLTADDLARWHRAMHRRN